MLILQSDTSGILSPAPGSLGLGPTDYEHGVTRNSRESVGLLWFLWTGASVDGHLAVLGLFFFFLKHLISISNKENMDGHFPPILAANNL